MTLFDKSVHNATTWRFLEHGCETSARLFQKKKSPDERQKLFDACKQCFNPYRLLMSEVEVSSPRDYCYDSILRIPFSCLQAVRGAFFYALIPVRRCMDSWQTALKEVLDRANFELKSYYSYREGLVVRTVFSVIHRTNPNISTVGLGRLISKHFNWSEGQTNSFIPIMRLPNSLWVAYGMAHVACHRISSVVSDEGFNGKTDLGCKLGSFTSEMMRCNAFGRQLRQFSLELPQEASNEAQARNTARMQHFGLDPRYGVRDELPWNSKNKLASAVSCLMQVTTCPPACFPLTALTSPSQAKAGDPYLRMLAELQRVISSYHGAVSDRFQHEDIQSKLVCVHVLIRFVRPVRMYGVNSLYESLQKISHAIKYSTQLTIAPVDFCTRSAPNNTLALAILAGFNDTPSASRDALWKQWTSPLPVPLPMSCLPSPPAAVIIQHATLDPNPFVAKGSPTLDIAWAGVNPEQQFAPSRAGTPRPPASRAGTPRPPASRAGTPKPAAEQASGLLLHLLQEALFSDPDFRPGTEDAKAKFHDLLLVPPAWIYSAEDAQLFATSVQGSLLARNTLKNSLLRCLKMLSEPMLEVGEAVFDASISMVEALRDGKDTIRDIERLFMRGYDNTRGILPVIRALSSVEVEPVHEFFGIGMKRPLDGAQTSSNTRRKKLASLVAAMGEHSKIRQIYVDLLLANDRLYAMNPSEGFCWNWAEIVGHVEELKDILAAGSKHCGELLQMMADTERDC